MTLFNDESGAWEALRKDLRKFTPLDIPTTAGTTTVVSADPVVGSNIAQFSQGGTLAVGSGTFKLPFTLNANLVSVQIAAGTSPTGADLVVDVNKNGTTIFTTQANRPTVPDGDADGVGSEATPDVTSVTAGDYLTVDVDQVGSTVAGSDMVVSVEWRPT